MRHWLMTYDGFTRFALMSPLLLLLLVVGLIALHLWAPEARRWTWKVLAGIAVLMLVLQAPIGLSWAPPERYQGDVYRIFYMHYPQIAMSMLGLTINFVASIAFLFKKSFVTDSIAEATAEVGTYFGVVGVALGAIWARPSWGAWWTWDPRLTASVIMLLIYAGYLTLRRFIEDPDKRATWSAVIGIIGYVDIPVVYFSVRWWRSIHQVQSNPSTVDSQMVMALRWSLVAFLALSFVFVYQRFLTAQARRSKEIALPEALPPTPEAA